MNKSSATSYYYFTGVASEIAELIGDEATAALVNLRGGMEINIPKKAKGSQLASIVGEENAAIIIRGLGTGKVRLPHCGMRGVSGRRARAKEMLVDGASHNTVALACDLHIRTVEKYSQELGNERQMQLPFDK